MAIINHVTSPSSGLFPAYINLWNRLDVPFGNFLNEQNVNTTSATSRDFIYRYSSFSDTPYDVYRAVLSGSNFQYQQSGGSHSLRQGHLDSLMIYDINTGLKVFDIADIDYDFNRDIPGQDFYQYWNNADDDDYYDRTDTSDFVQFYLGNDHIELAGGDDTAYGHGGRDEIYGGEGNDSIFGDAGNDTLYGEGGVDYLYGAADNDVIDGGGEIDTALYYGALSDYVLTRVDLNTITIRDLRSFYGTDTVKNVEKFDFYNETTTQTTTYTFDQLVAGIPTYNDGINDAILRQEEFSVTSFSPSAVNNLDQVDSFFHKHDDRGDKTFRWDDQQAGPLKITYSLIGTLNSSFDSSEYVDTPPYDLLATYVAGRTDWNSVQKANLEKVTKAWEQYANIDLQFFEETSERAGDIRLGLTNQWDTSETFALAKFPDGSDNAITGDIWFNNTATGISGSNFSSGSTAFEVALHELGHAVFGFEDISVTWGGSVWNESFWTVMSYNRLNTASATNKAEAEVITPMYLDILAARALYGAPTTDEAEHHVNGSTLKTIWDDGGIDTVIWDDPTAAYITLTTAPLTPQDGGGFRLDELDRDKGWSGLEKGRRIGGDLLYVDDWRFFISPQSVIENATGNSGNDTIIGNSVSNGLTGGGGNDALDGRAGADTSKYSGARASYEVTKIDATTVQIRDTRSGSPDGTDTVKNVEYFHFAVGDQTLSFQQLFLISQLNATNGPDVLFLTSNQTAHGLDGNDSITGDGNLNVAFGDQGGDQLYFVGDQNQLFGSEGNDWLGVNGTNNALVGGAGDEWIGASGSYNTVAGEDGHDTLFGNGVGNYLWGQEGNDWLGVSGNSNTLLGGAGVEWMGASGGGNALAGGEAGDTLLSIGSNILYGENGDDWVGCSGNSNWLFGHAGNDYLAASGNNNILDGGAGNDTLVAGGAHAGDRFVFHAGYGIDSVTGFSWHGAGGSDVIDLNGFGLNFITLQQYLSNSGGNCVITLDAATILTVNGVTSGQLLADDFIF